MSWFWRGFQSAIFYYVSCAPCVKLNHQRKGRRAKRRARAETTALEHAIPEGYRPSPFSTNIYWREEMALGPGPPPRKNKDKRASSSRELTTAGQGSSATSADTTLVVESLDGMEVEQERISTDGWNRKRYQRPDELLWGIDLEAGPRGQGGLSMSGISRTTTDGSGSYFTARNPAVNDLHPPVVSTQPTRKSETRWMLQPPPSAKIMEGKERANRSRTVSNVSRGSSNPASGNFGNRIAGGASFGDRSPISTPDILGQPHDRDSRLSSDSRSSSGSVHRKRPPPITISEDSKSLYSAVSGKAPPKTLQLFNRPSLSTIESSSHAIPTINLVKTELFATKNSSNSSPMSTTNSISMNALQELISQDSTLNTCTRSPSNENQSLFPSSKDLEDQEQTTRNSRRISQFANPEFRFPLVYQDARERAMRHSFET